MAEDVALLLTSPGAAAIAVVRVSGPGVAGFLQRRFSGRASPGRCVHGLLRDAAGAVVDDPVVVLTSDSSADLNLHGGIQVVRAVLELCRADGFEAADRLTDPLPVVAVDGADIIEQEMLVHLPRARTERALRALLTQPAAWRELQSAVDAGVASVDSLNSILNDRRLDWMLGLPRVAIVGPANVGKSTLANRLFNQERSITADLPGTTRDWVGEVANIGGLAVMLMDTPGRRAAGEEVDLMEQAALAASAPQVAAADAVVLVLDRSAALDDQATSLRQEFPGGIAVANKADRPAAWAEQSMDAIPIAATTGHNVDALVAAILRHFHCHSSDDIAARCWTQRQRDHLRSMIAQIEST